MAFESEFVPLELSQLHREAAIMKTEGWRFIQTHAANGEDGVDLYYSFMKDGAIRNYRVSGVKDEPVPSITDMFLAAFVFENEARELFGVNMQGIAIDFAGAMYAPAEQEPMTFISPEQKAAREKAKKAAAAKVAKEAAASSEAAPAGDSKPAGSGFVMTPERQARLDAKMATMSPEKKAKVEAALAALAANAGASGGADELRSEASQPSLRSSDSSEAQKSSASEATSEEGRESSASDATVVDAQLESLIGLMDDEKAAIVRAALDAKGGE